MKRREFFRKAGIGSAALVTLGSPAGSHAASDSHAHQEHPIITGPLATATVSFGAWTTPPGASELNRFPNVGASATAGNNVHAMIPHEVKIKAGGTVNFIIAGFHQVIVYGPGTKPEDINPSLTTTVGVPPGPPLIDDPTNRVFRGVDPSRQPTQDRVEVVGFASPGRYLVICGVQPHFVNDNMFGYVRVLR